MSKKVSELLSGEMIFSLVIILLGLIWTVSGIQTGVWFDDAPAGGFILVFIGVFLTLLGSVNFLGQFKAANQSVENEAKMNIRERRIVLISMAVALLGLALMNYILGTIITLTLFLIGWFKLYVQFSWGKTILFTICIMAAIFAVFILWLNVRFPTFLGLGFI